MQHDVRAFHAGVRDLREKPRGEVEARGRRGHRTRHAGKDRLVALEIVLARSVSSDVRGKRRFPNLEGGDSSRKRKDNLTFEAQGDELGRELRTRRAKGETLPHASLPSTAKERSK
jgi:hypothetical protein